MRSVSVRQWGWGVLPRYPSGGDACCPTVGRAGCWWISAEPLSENFPLPKVMPPLWGKPRLMTGQCSVEWIAPRCNLRNPWRAISAPELYVGSAETSVLDASKFNFFLCPILHPSFPLKCSWELPSKPSALNLSISFSVSKIPDLGQRQAFQAGGDFGK